ncbi:TM2 domain-containing protein [Ruminococcus sp. HUN007]|uniref:TM2 domain-containing protein n=1 Tax=Ruminococcus sp. HUN007 TaxID=1514668 RepID=UPI000A4A6A5C|nr:TM2 domain-containing protein [Ruminococcus sp. HUN007]
MNTENNNTTREEITANEGNASLEITVSKNDETSSASETVQDVTNDSSNQNSSVEIQHSETVMQNTQVETEDTQGAEATFQAQQQVNYTQPMPQMTMQQSGQPMAMPQQGQQVNMMYQNPQMNMMPQQGQQMNMMYQNPQMGMMPQNMQRNVPNGNTKFCSTCGAMVPAAAIICTSCGCQIGQMKTEQPNIVIQNTNTNVNTNNVGNYGRKKNKWVALLLCLLLGWCGIHRFYEGKIGTGLLYMFTLGLGGLGWFIDFIILLFTPNPYYV